MIGYLNGVSEYRDITLTVVDPCLNTVITVAPVDQTLEWIITEPFIYTLDVTDSLNCYGYELSYVGNNQPASLGFDGTKIVNVTEVESVALLEMTEVTKETMTILVSMLDYPTTVTPV